MNNKMTIFYFSATGNSLKVVQDIAKENSICEIIPISAVSKPLVHPECRKVGFVFPVYMGILPRVVKQFLIDFPVNTNTYYFSIPTYYKYKGIALSIVNNILKSKGAQLHYGSAIATVGNCLQEYEVSLKKRKILLQKADEKTLRILKKINNSVYNIANLGYCKLNENFHQVAFHLFFKDSDKKFTLEQTCTGCKMCANICPIKNISIIDGKPIWGSRCESCHACVHWCPQNAINIGKSKGRLQYHNPDIAYKELLQKV